MCLHLARICRGQSANWSVKEHCVAKILLATRETFLYENNCNFNFYKISQELIFEEDSGKCYRQIAIDNCVILTYNVDKKSFKKGQRCI